MNLTESITESFKDFLIFESLGSIKKRFIAEGVPEETITKWISAYKELVKRGNLKDEDKDIDNFCKDIKFEKFCDKIRKCIDEIESDKVKALIKKIITEGRPEKKKGVGRVKVQGRNHSIPKKWVLNRKNEYDVNDDVQKDQVEQFVENGQLTVKFGTVKGDFHCEELGLSSLKGCPKVVHGDFLCYGNELEDLEGGPETVKITYNCSANGLTSLKGAPKEVGAAFYCDSNSLKSMKGGPEKIGKTLDISENPLTELDGFPKEVGEDIIIDENIFWDSQIRKVCKVKGDVKFAKK